MPHWEEYILHYIGIKAHRVSFSLMLFWVEDGVKMSKAGMYHAARVLVFQYAAGRKNNAAFQ